MNEETMLRSHRYSWICQTKMNWNPKS